MAATSSELRYVPIRADFDAWRDAARELLKAGVETKNVVWSDDRQDALLPLSAVVHPAAEATSPVASRASFNVPKAFVDSARLVACHRDPARWTLLYRILFRLTHAEPHLLSLATDDDVIAFHAMERSVRRDRHKMTAFVRFRSVRVEGEAEHFVAYHVPEHYIVKLAAPFFRERFGPMRWTILTPNDSVSWDGVALRFGPGVSRDAAPTEDQLESLWLTYYRNIFNPARVKVKAMLKEMPRKYWGTMPETALIPELIAGAMPRVREMTASSEDAMADRRTTLRAAKRPAAGAPAPTDTECDGTPRQDPRDVAARLQTIASLPQLAEASRSCRLCNWACKCTQTVFGEGPAKSSCVFVGEQPGDQEDVQGRPFVGPAGKLFDRVLEQVGLDRSKVYVTNAVKHFKFEQRGTRRIHQTPNARDAANCRPWLLRELEIVRPPVLVCLGATAARSLLGNGFRITQSRGQPFESEHAAWTMATWHPSALLRVPDEGQRRAMEEQFADDLRMVAEQMKKVA